jgi:hypothetical protein
MTRLGSGSDNPEEDPITLAAIFAAQSDDPLLRWNHPNHVAGYLADLADLIYEQGIQESDSAHPSVLLRSTATKYRRAARATSRAAKKVWTKADRRRFQARWGKITGSAQTLSYPMLGDNAYNSITYIELVNRAALILCTQQVTEPRRVSYLGSADAWATITEDNASDLEIRWRIRDWLALTDDVTNIPPTERLAAAAAWRIGAHAVAFQIVLGAASAVVEKNGR